MTPPATAPNGDVTEALSAIRDYLRAAYRHLGHDQVVGRVAELAGMLDTATRGPDSASVVIRLVRAEAAAITAIAASVPPDDAA